MISKEIFNELLTRLEEAGDYVLATPEDAAFFRATARIKAELKAEVGVQKAEVKEKKEVPPVTPPVPIMSAPSPVPVKAEVGVQKAEVKEKKEIPLVTPPAPIMAAPSPPLLPSDFRLLTSPIRSLLSVVAPELAIINEIPSDAMAKKIAERWKTKNQSAPISILLYQEPPEQRALLEQIATAVDVYFGPAKIVNAEKIEKEKQWDAFLSVADLKMVIVCDYTLWQLGGLLQFFKETPAQGIRTLGNVPVFLLPDLSLYLKDPLLKRSLWKALCQKFS